MAAWTAAEDVRLRDLHAAGKSLTAIAAEMGRPKGTVSGKAKAAGLSFDRSRTAKAAEAVHIDNKARRALLEERLLTEADKVLDRMWSPAIVFSFGGAANTYAEHTLDVPTPADQKAIMQTASTALTTAGRLHELNSGRASDQSRSLLVQMQTALLDAVTGDAG